MKKPADPVEHFLFLLKIFALDVAKIPVFVLKEINIIRSQRLSYALVFLYPILAIVSVGFMISGTTGIDVALGSTPQAKIPVGVFFPESSFSGQIINDLRSFEYLEIAEFETRKGLLDAISSSRARLGIELVPPKDEYSSIETKFYYDNSNFIAASTIVGQLKTVVQNISLKKSAQTLSFILSDINSIEHLLSGQRNRIESILFQVDAGSQEIEKIEDQLAQINLDGVREKLESFSFYYDEGKTDIAQTILDINAVSGKIEKNMATVQNLSEKVSLVKNSISPVLTVLDDASTKLKESGQEELALQIGGVHDAVNAQVLELEKINSDLKSIESDLNETEQKMLAATEKLLLADSRLDTAKQSIDELKENIFELQSIIDETSIALKKSAQSRRALRQDLIDAKNLLEGLILQLSAIKNYSPEFLSSPVQVSIEPLYEFSRVTALVPFTIALVLLLTCLLLSSTSMINEQNWGIIFRLKSSPTGFASWLAGKMLGQAIIALFETILIFAVAILLFGVLLPNDILGVFFAVFISALAFASIGIWITNFMKTTSNSIFTSLLLIVPMIFLSGIIVPIEFMPPFLDFIARILPFTASIDLIQGIYLRKVSALEMGFTIIPLAVITVFCTLWTYFYRKKKLL